MDTFDLKPDAAAEFRGEFNPIETNVPGVEISEHLPKLAKCADKFAILRGVSHTPGRARAGHRVHEHRQPADPVAGISPATARW